MSSPDGLVEPTSNSGVALAAIKGASILLLVAVSIFLGLAPLKIKGFTTNQRLLGYINSFSAGLFLGMGLLHLLCGSLTDYTKYMKLNMDTEATYPVPVLITIGTFSLILLFEKVVFAQHELIHAVGEKDLENQEKDSLRVSPDNDRISEPLLIRSREISYCDPENEEANFKQLLNTKQKLAKTTLGRMRLRTLERLRKFPSAPIIKETTSDLGPLKLISDQEIEPKQLVEEEHEHEHEHHHAVGPISILVALSIHGMFEGIAVGIQNTPGGVINLVIAVLLHKWAEALTLGIALFKAKIPHGTIIYQMIVFSLAGPLGIAIGWILARSSFLISAIFKAIPAGTFLYVATAELIVEEFSISKQVKRKFLCYLAGIAMMGLVLLLDK